MKEQATVQLNDKLECSSAAGDERPLFFFFLLVASDLFKETRDPKYLGSASLLAAGAKRLERFCFIFFSFRKEVSLLHGLIVQSCERLTRLCRNVQLCVIGVS